MRTQAEVEEIARMIGASEESARMLDVSPEYVRLAMKVRARGVPDLARATEQGYVHIKIAAKIAECDDWLQTALLSEIELDVD